MQLIIYTQNIVFRSLLETMTFVSGFNASIQHPLLYKHPIRHDDTIMLALGILSGQYIQTQPDGKTRVLSVEETQFIQGYGNTGCGVFKWGVQN